VLLQVVGGGWQKLGRKASLKFNYCELAKVIAEVCGSTVPPVLTGCGPTSLWSQVLVRLNRPDNRSARKKHCVSTNSKLRRSQKVFSATGYCSVPGFIGNVR